MTKSMNCSGSAQPGSGNNNELVVVPQRNDAARGVFLDYPELHSVRCPRNVRIRLVQTSRLILRDGEVAI